MSEKRSHQFGARVREVREERKKTDQRFSVRGFAKMVGLSPTFISFMERGQFAPPSPQKIIRMAEVLDLNADELLSLAGRVDPALIELICQEPVFLPFVLRAASGLSGRERIRLRSLLTQFGRGKRADRKTR